MRVREAGTRAAVLLLALALVVGGCASPVVSPQPTGTTGSSPVPTEAGDPNREFTLTVWHAHGPNFDKIVAGVIEQYKAIHPNANVQIVPVTNDVFLQRALTAAAGLGLPDVMYGNSMIVGPLFDKKVMSPVDPSVITDLSPWPIEYRNSFTDAAGDLIFVPHLGGPGAFFLRTDLVDLGGRLPLTWDEWMDYAQKAVERDANGNITREGFSWRYTQFGDNWVLQQYRSLLLASGIDFLNEDQTRAAFNNAQGLAALQFMHDTIWKYRVSLPPSKKVIPADNVMPITAGTAAAEFMGAWAPGGFIPAEPKYPEFKNNWDVRYAFPKPTGGRDAIIAGGDGWGVPATSRNKREAWEFVKILTSKEIAAEFVTTYLHPVIRTDAMAESSVRSWVTEKMPGAAHYFDAWTGEWADPSNYVVATTYNLPQSPELDRLVLDKIGAALEDANADLAAVIADMEASVNRLLSQ